MRVLLVNPPLDVIFRKGQITPVTAYLFYNSAPLGLLYIAAALEQVLEKVAVLDAAAEKLDVARTVRRALQFQPDVIGIGSTTVAFQSALELARALEEALPGVPRVLGGAHVTILPEDAMSSGSFHVGVLDEGEATMLDLVKHFRRELPLEEVDGVVFRRPDGALHFTAPRTRRDDLDSLPMPARHLLPPNLYRPIPIDEHAMPKFAMITSRGCPHRCVFCQKAASGYRSHSPGRIVDEMEHLVRDYGARDIAFVDSLFCISKKRVMEICDEIIRRGVKVSWTCSTRVEVVDRELLQRMREAGCWRTRFGIESGSSRVLSFISKGITKDIIRDAITWADEVGLRPKAFFIIGHLVDDRDSIMETISFAKSIPLHDVTVQINTLLPHTRQMEIFQQEGEKYGRLVTASTDDASFWEPTFVPWGLEPEDLLKLHRRFYREFYFRPETVTRHMGALRSPRDLLKYLQAVGLFGFLFMDRKAMDMGLVKALFGTHEETPPAA